MRFAEKRYLEKMRLAKAPPKEPTAAQLQFRNAAWFVMGRGAKKGRERRAKLAVKAVA